MAPAAPLDSALLMAGDELLTLRDILSLRPGATRLIVLSACETGQPGTDLPDEVVSFPSGLLQSGCRGVIATQWSVTSMAAALLIAAFYRRLTDGLSPTQALRAAQAWLRNATNADLAECLRPDHASDTLGLPADTARPLWMAARRRPPTNRPYAHPVEWAAFAHVGA